MNRKATVGCGKKEGIAALFLCIASFSDPWEKMEEWLKKNMNSSLNFLEFLLRGWNFSGGYVIMCPSIVLWRENYD
jgi:hypothetical protein